MLLVGWAIIHMDGSESVAAIIELFMECESAIRNGELIHRENRQDKEFHFQNWFGARLRALSIAFDPPARNTYPDFRLVKHSEGYEVKGLSFPGRIANYDCNSQMPSGLHNEREIYYVFGRYPKEDVGNDFPVYDLVICHGDFLNADHNYVHANKNVKGFGSYGDIMIRDRKMYVAPTPFAITAGTAGQVTLILPSIRKTGVVDLASVGELTRIETDQLVKGYTANLSANTLLPSFTSNPNAGTKHRFTAYRHRGHLGPDVSMVKLADAVKAENTEEVDE